MSRCHVTVCVYYCVVLSCERDNDTRIIKCLLYIEKTFNQYTCKIQLFQIILTFKLRNVMNILMFSAL